MAESTSFGDRPSVPDLQQPHWLLHGRSALMVMFPPVTSGTLLDAAPMERAGVDRLVRQTADAKSVRRVQEQQDIAGNRSVDDQFAVTFRMLMSGGGAQPLAQLPQTASRPSDTAATTGADGPPVLKTGTCADATPRIEAEVPNVSGAAGPTVTSHATASGATPVQHIGTSTRLGTDSASPHTAGVQADIQSPDTANLNASILKTVNRGPLPAGSESGALKQALMSTIGDESFETGAASISTTFPADLSETIAAVLPQIGRPASDLSDGAGVQRSDVAATRITGEFPAVRSEPELPMHLNSSDVIVDASKEISVRPALSNGQPLARRLVIHEKQNDPLPADADQLKPGQIPLVQTAGAFASPELSTTSSGELRQPLAHQVSLAVMDRLGRGDLREAESLTVRLDPPELGEIVIELSKTRDGLTVRVTAREAVTMDMLLARGSDIESQLRGRELNLKTLEFLSPNMNNGNGFERQQDNSARQSGDLQSVRRSARRPSREAVTMPGGAPSSDEPRHAMSFRA